MNQFRNKKPGSVSNVKVKTETRKLKTPTNESVKMQQKRALHVPAQGRSKEEDAKKVGKVNNKSTWIRDNHTAIPRASISAADASDNQWIESIISSKQLVDLQAKQYTSYFDDLNSEDGFPSVQLLLPGRATEDYQLAIPKNKDNYSPIHDLMRTVSILITHFITPSQRPSFGVAVDGDDTISAANDNSILRLIQRSFNRREGKTFIDAILKFNDEYSKLIESNQVIDYLKSLDGIHPEVWVHISNQTYQRVVGPKVNDLRNYEAFSSNIYGEIMPPFVAHIAHRLKIGPSSSLIDLGAGVGNLVFQMSLATGCKSFGVEQMNAPADLAFAQLSEGRARSFMYGLSSGEMEFEKGDFCNSEKLSGKLPDTDVVLINNSFSAELNERLSLLFLDLKDNVKIVSLKPFLPHNFRITDATVNSPLAILRMEKGDYFPGSVSWTDKGGNYYIHTVDRSALNKYLQNH